jgi:signal transduction histidine kinase
MAFPFRLLALAVAVSAAAFAQTGTPKQAETLVTRAVAYAKQNGMEKLIQQTNQANGIFHVGSGSQLYIFIYDQAGICKAIGYNTQALVGKDRSDLKDSSGFLIIKAFLNTAKTKGKGWVDYKYSNPLTGKEEPKTSYVEACDGLIIGAGIYK